MLTTLRSLPRRFVLARWDDGWTLSRMPKMEGGAWFVIDDPDGKAPIDMGFFVKLKEDSPIVLQLNEFSMIGNVMEKEYARPYSISEAYRRKVAWFVFEFMGLTPDQAEGLSILQPAIPEVFYNFSRSHVRQIQISRLKDWNGVWVEDLQPGNLFPEDRVRRFDAAHEMTDAMLRSLSLTSHNEVSIFPRGTEDPAYKETRWQVDLEAGPRILVVAQHIDRDEQPTWRLHRWDWDVPQDSKGYRSRGYPMTRADLDDPGDRFRLLATSDIGPLELLEQAGLIILEEDLDDWIDAHIDVPTVVPVVAQTMEAYDLLDSALYAPIFAGQFDFYTWWKTLQETP